MLLPQPLLLLFLLLEVATTNKTNRQARESLKGERRQGGYYQPLIRGTPHPLKHTVVVIAERRQLLGWFVVLLWEWVLVIIWRTEINRWRRAAVERGWRQRLTGHCLLATWFVADLLRCDTLCGSRCFGVSASRPLSNCRGSGHRDIASVYSQAHCPSPGHRRSALGGIVMQLNSDKLQNTGGWATKSYGRIVCVSLHLYSGVISLFKGI